MDLMEIGSKILSDKLGSDVDAGSISSALSGLLGGDQGGIDVAGLASKMADSGDLGNILKSWLGDGANSAISAQSITDLLGNSSVADFASKLGTDSETAAAGLADALPQMMANASSGGSLLDTVGGMDGILGAAKSFLK